MAKRMLCSAFLRYLHNSTARCESQFILQTLQIGIHVRKKEKNTGRGARDRIPTGEIPWSREEMGEALSRAATLHMTPHDDWDRRQKGLDLVDDDGSVSRIIFNPDMMPNQIMDFIIARQRAKGASEEVMMSHMWRFMESMAFLKQNDARLRESELIIDDPNDPDAAMISEALIEVLATARYEGVSLQGRDGDPVRTFHVERVIAEAKRLDESDDAG